MAEITNLNVKLQNNPYADIVISLIGYFNNPNTRTSNPLEAIAVAGIMSERLISWNNTGPIQVNVSYELCCCPEVTLSGSNCTWVTKTPGTVGTNCPACADDAVSLRTGSPILPLKQLLQRIGIENQTGDPYTPAVTTFLKQMNSISMNGANDWIFFQQMRDVFFENVSFINFITADAVHSDLYLSIIGGYFRDGYNKNGLFVSTIIDGSSTPGTKSITTITVDLVVAGDDQKYWEIYSDATNRWIPYLQVDGSGTGDPVVAPIGGITDHFVALAVVTGAPAADLASTVIIQLNAAPAWGFDTVVAGRISDAIITTLINGSQAPSVDAGPAHDTWAMGYVNGTADTPGNSELTDINYGRAKTQSLIGQWFKMYGAADDGVMFYYQFQDHAVDPATLGTTYASAVPINLPIWCLPDGPCPDDPSKIEQLTTLAIVGTGLFEVAAAGLQEKCCDCIGRDVFGEPIPGCCGPCKRYGAVASENFSNSDSGTAGYGANYQIQEVLAPDGTSFGSADDDLEYARLWNNNVVTHMANLGQRVHYLAPQNAKGPRPCRPCTPDEDNCGPECYDPPTGATGRSNNVGSIMLQTTYPSIVADLRFNVPGTTTQAIDWNDCPTCLT